MVDTLQSLASINHLINGISEKLSEARNIFGGAVCIWIRPAWGYFKMSFFAGHIAAKWLGVLCDPVSAAGKLCSHSDSGKIKKSANTVLSGRNRLFKISIFAETDFPREAKRSEGVERVRENLLLFQSEGVDAEVNKRVLREASD